MVVKAAVVTTAIVVATAGFGIVNELSAHRHELVIESQIEACQRGNAVREVVFRNTEEGVRSAASQREATSFAHNLGILVAPPEVDDETGLVDCEAAVR